MLLSEMLGVEMDTDFGVEGYYGKFRVRVNTGYEFLVVSDGKGAYDTVVNGATVYGIINASPANIIHLPPPLTDEQREQLKAIWTLGGRWLVMEANKETYFFKTCPKREFGYWEMAESCCNVFSDNPVCRLVKNDDDKPFDIGKALGVEG